MAECPLCNAQVADDFGLLECNNCGAQLLVHMDGRVEHSGNQPPLTRDDITQAGVANDNSSPFAAPLTFESFKDSSALFEEPELEAGELHDNTRVEEVEPHVEIDPPMEAVEELPTEHSDEAGEVSFDTPIEPTVVDETYQVASDSPDLSDVAEFGNSAEMSGQGGLRYNLLISGVDTSDIREAFREALTDRRFVWDTETILRGLKNGEVRIPNISAVKAFILISSLRNLPVRVRWEQYAIHQT